MASAPQRRSTGCASSPGNGWLDRAILVVEAETSFGRELVKQLRADCYQAVLAQTPEHARALARARPVRAIVLSRLDASGGALDLLKEIRSGSDATGRNLSVGVDPGGLTMVATWDECSPVIVLSRTDGRLELSRAFELGADDFIGRVDPAAMEVAYVELRARLGAVLRRAEASSTKRLLRVGSLEIDRRARSARVGGAPVELCRLEYELLVRLADDASGVCSKRDLLADVWKQQVVLSTRTVDSHASRLRRKLAAAGAPGLVVNVRGVGYRLV